MPPPKSPTTPDPIGPLLVKNLYRLGYAEIVVKSTVLSKLVSEKTGRTMSRQRISTMMNAVRIETATVELLAKAIGVKAAELTKDVQVTTVATKK